MINSFDKNNSPAFERGVTLVEVLVVTALLGLVSFFAIDSGILSAKTNQAAMLSAEFNDTVSLVVNILGHSDSCSAAFKELQRSRLSPCPTR